jgi:hypothetical protein
MTQEMTVEAGRLVVRVPSRRADLVKARLEKHGLRATLHWTPWEEEARLELWPGAEPDKVRAALAC